MLRIGSHESLVSSWQPHRDVRRPGISMSAAATQRVVVGKGRVGLALKDMIGPSCILGEKRYIIDHRT